LTLFVDKCRWLFRDRLWCHLVSDSSYDELHSFASSLGLPRIAFQGDHYDLHETLRAAALDLGATPVESTHIVRALKASGLRRGPALLRGGLDAVQHLPAPRLETARLILRQWQADDIPAMIALAQDGEVMHWLGGPRPAENTIAALDQDAVGLAVRGVGKWAATLKSSGELIGRIGLSADFNPVEIGWRLRREFWGHGFAVEGAQAALTYGFEHLEVREIAAFTHSRNTASRNVMNRLGMSHDPTLDERRPHISYERDSDLTVVYRLKATNLHKAS
jgi:RimJ/RimL family protein N-acetyltransferase